MVVSSAQPQQFAAIHVLLNNSHSFRLKSFSFRSGATSCAAGASASKNTTTVHQKLYVGQSEFSWTKLISDKTRCGQCREALKMYREMREAGVRWSTYTFVAALKACGSLGDLETGKEIHGRVIESGVESELFVANALMDMYAKCGSMEDARRIFNRMPFRDGVSWNIIILGYAQMDEGAVALQLYEHMHHEQGISPNARTFVGALKACASLAAHEEGQEVAGKLTKLGSLRKGKIIHSQIEQSRFNSDMFVATTLVDMYAKCGSMDDARQVFDRMPFRNVVSWTAMILGYAQMDEGESALRLYARMRHEGITPNARTFVGALKACASLATQEEGKEVDGKVLKLGSLKRGKGIHIQILHSKFNSDIFVSTTLVDMYAKCGSMDDAHRVFGRMPLRNVVSWTAMILGYVQMEEYELALQIYEHMQHEGIAPTAQTFIAALKACSFLATQEEGEEVAGKVVKLGSLNKGKAIHFQVAQSGFGLDIFVSTTLVDMYAKCGSTEDARQVFDRMPFRNVVSWTAMIMGYAKMEEGELALQLYARMQVEGVQPNAPTFVGALKACSSLAALEEGKKIHAEICRVRLEGDTIVANSLIDMYCKCGSMGDAQKLFDSLPTKDLFTWNTLIAGHSRQGNSERVFSLFQEMQQQNILPNDITFLSILNVCSHMGLVYEGWMYFQAMSAHYRISPTIDHCNCMIDLLGRAGKLHEAMVLVKKMPFQPNLATWRTVLGACLKWNDEEVGKHAFECAVRLDDNHAAVYVLMSNIYTSVDKCEASYDS